MASVVIIGIFVSSFWLIFAVVALIILLVNKDSESAGWAIIPGAVSITFWTFTIIGIVKNNEVYDKQLYLIESLTIKYENQEPFVLGLGRQKDETYYYYYYQNEDGYHLGRQKVEETVVIKNESTTPQVRKLKEKGKLEPIYKIYVPLNAVVTTFNLD